MGREEQGGAEREALRHQRHRIAERPEQLHRFPSLAPFRPFLVFDSKRTVAPRG
jgi:hypothetical protein